MGAERARTAATEERLDAFAAAMRDRPESPEWEHIARHLSGVKACSCDEAHALSRAVAALLEARGAWAAATRAARMEASAGRMELLKLAARLEGMTTAEVVAALEALAWCPRTEGGAR